MPFTVVTKEKAANDANAEKKAEFDSRPASKHPIETEFAPSKPSIPSIPKEPTLPKFPKILGEISMGESRWAKEDSSPNSGNSRRGGRNARYGRGGSPSGHSPASSRQGSIVSLPQSQEENWNRNQGRAQQSSNWGDVSAGAGGTNGGGWSSALTPTLPSRDEAYTWGSDSITEETKQLKDDRGTDSVPTGKTQPQVDGKNWGADTVPAEINRKYGIKERSHDWGAGTGIDVYSHSRPVRDSQGARGAHSGNLGYDRLNREFDGLNASDTGYRDVPKKSQDVESLSGSAQEPISTWDDKPGWQPSRFKKHEPKW